MDIIEKLNELRLERGLSVYRLSELSGINQSTLANTFSRRTVPSIYNLEILCETMGITLSQFFSCEESREILTEEERALIKNFRKLDKNLQATTNKLLEEIVLKTTL